MSEELLPYYNRELAYVRRLGADFAKRYPKIAGRLRIGEDQIEDPHVSRLIEAFAFLTARIRHKLDDGFPELTDALLGVLYPDYQAPLPSMSILQFVPQNDLAGPVTIERGEMLETLPVHGEPCTYQTSFPTRIWPLKISNVRLQGAPFAAPSSPARSKANAILKIELQTLTDDIKLSDLDIDQLRFFIKGQEQHTFKLFELIMNNTLGISIAESHQDEMADHLPSCAIKAVGFDEEEAVLPWSQRSFSGYRLMAEYFLFPQKYLFFDLTQLKNKLVRYDNRVEITLFLSQTQSELEHAISPDNLALNATPIINLFKRRAEPFSLDDAVDEYHIIPDIRRQDAFEVYSVDRVSATCPNMEPIDFLPFYGSHRSFDEENANQFWHVRRESAEWAGARMDEATETHISLVDLTFELFKSEQPWTLNIETTCLNRNLPNRLPFGAGQPQMQLLNGMPEIAKLQCLTPPTPTRRPVLRDQSRWQLITHITLNHFSDDDGLDLLKQTLSLYDFVDEDHTRNLVDGITALSTRPMTARVNRQGRAAICQGTAIEVELDEPQFSGSGLFLFASVLDRFFARYCTINSFTKLTVKLRNKTNPLVKWPPRSGTAELI